VSEDESSKFGTEEEILPCIKLNCAGAQLAKAKAQGSGAEVLGELKTDEDGTWVDDTLVDPATVEKLN